MWITGRRTIISPSTALPVAQRRTYGRAMSRTNPANAVGTNENPGVGTGEGARDGLRVDTIGLRRTASALADLFTCCAEDRALAAALGQLQAGAATASTGAAAEVVDATQSRLRDQAAATLAFADGLTEAAQRYADADSRADIRAKASG
jgi:hypothetical protein